MIKWLEWSNSWILDQWKQFVQEIIDNVKSIEESWIEFSNEEIKSWIEAKIWNLDTIWISSLSVMFLKNHKLYISESEETALYWLVWFLEENSEIDFIKEINEITNWISDFDTYIKLKISSELKNLSSNDIDNLTKINEKYTAYYVDNVLEILKYCFFKHINK